MTFAAPRIMSTRDELFAGKWLTAGAASYGLGFWYSDVLSDWAAFIHFGTQGSWADFTALAAIVIVALSPLLRRLYIERFWIHGRGAVIRVDGGFDYNPDRDLAWVWTPIIEYHAAGQRFSSRVSPWQRFNAKSKYSVGDEVDILYHPRNPSRVMLDSWIEHIILTIFLTILVSVLVASVASRGPNR